MRNTLARHSTLLCFMLFLVGFCVLAATRGSDGSWDLRNYHIYNPFALLHGKLGTDIAPAQMQSFNGPQLDLIYDWLRTTLNDRPIVLNAILAIPHAIAAFLAWRIALLFISAAVPWRVALGLTAAVIGATGASALPTLAGSYSDVVPTCLCLAGLLLLLSDVQGSPGRTLRAGVLFGLAAGLKLTVAPFCVAAGLALLIAPAVPLRQRLSAVVTFGLGQAAALVLVAGPWWLVLATRYRSPLFPYLNNVFHSPYYSAVGLTDDRFKPVDIAHAIFYPLYWAWETRPMVSELPMRDPRFAVALVAVLATLVRMALARRRPDARTLMFVVFFLASYILWEAQFSIFRYLTPSEFLCGVALLIALRPAGAVLSSRHQWAGMVVVGLLAVTLTVYPDWGHVSRRGHAVAVTFPPQANDALVVMLDGSPMAYVAAFASPGTRFVGANSNLIWPGQDTLLAHHAEAVIRGAEGPVWGLENPAEAPGVADAPLKYYGLRRDGTCARIVSNLDGGELRLCRLVQER